MASLTFKKNDGTGGPMRRRPLLPDDRFLNGVCCEVAEETVPDRFNGGEKQVLSFTIELPEFDDPQGDAGDPRRVKYKVNHPGTAGVHEKSKLYQLVVACCGGVDPWKTNANFDVTSIATKRMPLQVFMGTSDPKTQEILDETDKVVTVHDYCYQWVAQVRMKKAAAGTAPVAVPNASAPAAAPATTAPAAAAPAVRGKGKKAEPKPAEADPLAEVATPAAAAAPAVASEAMINALKDGIKPLLANDVGKKKVKEACAKFNISSMAALSSLTADQAHSFAKLIGIVLEDDTAGGDDDLSFLS